MCGKELLEGKMIGKEEWHHKEGDNKTTTRFIYKRKNLIKAMNEGNKANFKF